MKMNYCLSAIVVLFAASTGRLQAQMPGATGAPLNAAMVKLFGKHTNFTATTEMRVLDGAKAETMSTVLTLAMLDGKMRAETDMSKMKTKMLTPALITQMKDMGADRTIFISRPDKKVTYLAYPGLNIYVELALSAAEVEASGKDGKLAKTVLGKETVDGHPCEKVKVVVTDEQGQTQEAIVWNATDFQNFPIQMETTEKGSTIVMKYTNVRLTKPDAKQFEPPVGATRYTSMEQLQQAMMQRMLEKASQ